MITIFYESHATSVDNVARRASGHDDVPLARDRGDSSEADGAAVHGSTVPVPNGESYVQSATRIRAFLTDLLRDHEGKTVLVIGHRATHYGLEHWINGTPLAQFVAEERPWVPGQVYLLKGGQTNEVGHPQERQG